MLSCMRTRAPGVPGFFARSLIVAMIAAAAGCSADVTRFSYNGSQTTGSIPVPDEPVGRGGPPRGLGLSEAPLPPPADLPPSYGPAANADILGVPVVIQEVTETTTLGAAYLAGLAMGFWKDPGELTRNFKVRKKYIPRMSSREREGLHRKWKKAVEKAKGWEEEN